MAYALSNRQVFDFKMNGEQKYFVCYSQGTRNGFRHLCFLTNDKDAIYKAYEASSYFSKVCYLNRTWERFTFESVLQKAISKLAVDEASRKKIYAHVIDKMAEEEHEKTEAFIGNFKALYDGLNDKQKEQLASSNIHIENEDQARSLMALMALGNLMN